MGVVERALLSHIAHRWHPIAAPLSPGSVERLLQRVPVPYGPCRAVDHGCGGGEWLIRLLSANPHMTGVGVDVSPWAIARATELARHHGVGDRVELLEADAAHLDVGTADVALCVGASHIFGGLQATLEALEGSLVSTGAAVLGVGFWAHPPTPAAVNALGLDSASAIPDLPQVADAVAAAGFALRTAHVSTPEEWDDYERSWAGALLDWADTDPDADEEDRQQARQAAAEHQQGWLDGYRGILGFTTLILQR